MISIKNEVCLHVCTVLIDLIITFIDILKLSRSFLSLFLYSHYLYRTHATIQQLHLTFDPLKGIAIVCWCSRVISDVTSVVIIEIKAESNFLFVCLLGYWGVCPRHTTVHWSV